MGLEGAVSPLAVHFVYFASDASSFVVTLVKLPVNDKMDQLGSPPLP